MNPSLLLIAILFPIVFSVFIPLIPFKKRAHMEIYIEVIVIATSVMVFLLLINRPGELVLIDCDNTDAVKRAGWEFIQFLMSDEQIARNAIKTGYLPTTKDISENKTMADFWAENPLYKVAYEQLSCARSEAYPYFENRAEFRTNCQSVISLMVQEGSITAEQAVEPIKLENAHLFENGF